MLLTERGSKHLVHGVVPPNIFAQYQQFPIGSEETGRMNTTGLFKELLLLAQGIGQDRKDGGPDQWLINGRGHVKVCGFLDSINGRSAANAARA